jgi:hypothetical protein
MSNLLEFDAYYDDDDDDDESVSYFTPDKHCPKSAARNYFSEYDSEDDDASSLSAKEETERRRRNKKQLRRLSKQLRNDSGVLLVDRFNDMEWDALLHALLVQDANPTPPREILSIVRVRRNSREWTRTRTVPQVQQLFHILGTRLSGLVHLDVTGFDGTTEEMHALAQCLNYHPTLLKLELDTENFDPTIVRALETIPYLESIALDIRDSTPLAPLVSSCKNLKHLKVSSYYYFFYNNNDAAAFEMIHALKTSAPSTLESLEIKLVSDSMVKALVDMLRTNTSLKSLTFAALLDGDQQKANEFCIDLANALAVNTTLKSLVISNEMWVGQQGTNALLDMLLCRNSTLEKLKFDWWPYSNPADVQDFEDSKNFFLKHNRLGTQRLIVTNQFPTSHWIELMSEHCHDAKLLYYFLKMDPSLCRRPTSADGLD